MASVKTLKKIDAYSKRQASPAENLKKRAGLVGGCSAKISNMACLPPWARRWAAFAKLASEESIRDQRRSRKASLYGAAHSENQPKEKSKTDAEIAKAALRRRKPA